jgi:hypothetical protein
MDNIVLYSSSANSATTLVVSSDLKREIIKRLLSYPPDTAVMLLSFDDLLPTLRGLVKEGFLHEIHRGKEIYYMIMPDKYTEAVIKYG